jgi:hypothetical protein
MVDECLILPAPSLALIVLAIERIIGLHGFYTTQETLSSLRLLTYCEGLVAF